MATITQIITQDVSASAITPDKAALTASWSFTDGEIFVPNPTLAQHAAPRDFVLDAVQGLRDPKDSVRLTTSGSDVTLTGTFTLDGLDLAIGDRVLIRNQTTASQNGIYVVSASAWARSPDADEDDEVTQGLFAFVSTGSEFGGSSWLLVEPDPIVVDVTTQSYIQINGLGQITAGDGLTKNGNVLNVGAGYGIVVTRQERTPSISGRSDRKACWFHL